MNRFHFIKPVLLIAAIVISISSANAQKIGFISSDEIRKQFSEAQQADQRITSIVEEWKRELASYEQRIENLENDIKKNRLIWTEEERKTKEKELESLKAQKQEYARKKFEAGGEYDQTVKTILKPIEDKIYAAMQKVATAENFDLIWDKSKDPLPYVNYKYDITVKVLKELGVDVKKLEEELEAKIAKDPRNQKQETKGPPKGRSRERSRNVNREENENIENEKINEEKQTNEEKKEPNSKIEPK
jgi:Skp family chaperone for outer membrane proteins